MRRVLAAERAAAVTAHAAVAVHDDLAAGQAGVALRPADDEASGRVDEKLRLLVEQMLRQNFLDDFLDAKFLDRPCASRRAACCVEMTTFVMSHRLVVFVLDGNLRFASGRSQRDFAGLADARQFAAKLVRDT